MMTRKVLSVRRLFGFVLFSSMAASMVAGAEFDQASIKAKVVPRADAFFGLHFDLHPGPGDKALGADVIEEMVDKLLTRVKPDYIQYDSKGHAGYLGWPSKVGPSAPSIVRDSLGIWRKVTRDHGVALFIHFSGLFDIAANAAHPEYAAVGSDGKPDPNATSVFGPYVDKVMIPQLVEAASKYDLDGAWVDGECWAAVLDYSAVAMEAWKKETGLTEAPRKRGEPNWLKWKQFHRRHLEQYVSHWVDAVHTARPGFQVASNWIYTTLVPKPVVAKVDFISGDYDPCMSVDRARIEARYMANVRMPWDLLAWGFVHGFPGAGMNLKPAVHLEQEAAVTLMQGGGIGIYYQPTRSGHITDGIIETSGQVADFCRARQKVSHKSTSIPQVALLMSTTSMLDRSDAVGSTGGTYQELLGTMHALLELHYSVDVLAEYQIKGRFHDYPFVAVPDFDEFEPTLRDQLIEYVEQGGKVLLVGEKCARLLEPILGIRFEGQPQEVPAELAGPAGIFGCGGVWQQVSLQGAEAIGYRYPVRDIRKDGEIAATLARHGQGLVAAIYGPVGERFLKMHHPYLRSFIGDIARRVFTGPAIEVAGPPCIEIALRRTRDGLPSLHILNRANMPTSNEYGTIDYVPPVGPLEIRWRLMKKPKQVEWIPDGGELKWSWANGILSATVPSVGIHGVVVVH